VGYSQNDRGSVSRFPAGKEKSFPYETFRVDLETSHRMGIGARGVKPSVSKSKMPSAVSQLAHIP